MPSSRVLSDLFYFSKEFLLFSSSGWDLIILQRKNAAVVFCRIIFQINFLPPLDAVENLLDVQRATCSFPLEAPPLFSPTLDFVSVVFPV